MGANSVKMLTIEGKALALKTLKAVKELFVDNNRWCTGTDAKTSSGLNISPCDPRATSFDVVGGVKAVTGKDHAAFTVTVLLLFSVLPPEIRKEPGGQPVLADSSVQAKHRLQEWNDGVARDFAEVHDLIDRAIAEAQQGDLF